MASSSTCGGNTTCLLEGILLALEKANDEFKWDLPSFIATLLLGLIALGYAILPIIQGVLARLSSQRFNSKAIGRWSQETEFTWTWSELRFLAVVRTPLLDLRQKYRTMGSEFRRAINAKDSTVKNEISKPSTLSPDVDMESGQVKGSTIQTKMTPRPPHAGWLNLLRKLHANDDLWFETFESHLETPADVIPSEFSAAYSYGSR